MESKESIFDEVSTMMQELFEVDPDQISPEANLNEDLGLDSIDAIDMVLQLQDKADIEVDPEEFKNVRTVQDVVDAVYELLHGAK